jgi:hypothetical protein
MTNIRRRRIEICFKENDKYHVHINPTPIPQKVLR